MSDDNQKTMNRRKFLGLTAGTAAAGIAGCGKDNSNRDSTSTPTEPPTETLTASPTTTATDSPTASETPTDTPTDTATPTDTPRPEEYILDVKPGEDQPDFVESIVFSSHETDNEHDNHNVNLDEIDELHKNDHKHFQGEEHGNWTEWLETLPDDNAYAENKSEMIGAALLNSDFIGR